MVLESPNTVCSHRHEGRTHAWPAVIPAIRVIGTRPVHTQGWKWSNIMVRHLVAENDK
jgi:hypothetical protein